MLDRKTYHKKAWAGIGHVSGVRPDIVKVDQMLGASSPKTRLLDTKVQAAIPVCAVGETPRFQPGDPVRVSNRWPIAHYRVPLYLRGRVGWIETVIEPTAVNNEEEGFGRNAGDRRHYYRVAFAMTEVWPDYAGSPHDSLRIEVFESWLEKEKT